MTGERGASGGLRFRPRQRLQHKRDFDRVFARKCSAADAAMVVYVERNSLAWSRLGLSVSARIGPAVTRNHVKRRLREAFRLSNDAIPPGLDIVVVARNKAADPAVDLADSLRRLTARACRELNARA